MVAHDAKCVRQIVNIDDGLSLQKDSDEPYHWSIII